MSDPAAHLLIVDDDERIRGLLQKYLMRQGFHATTARDAAQARRILAGLDFDLIVLDVMMPGEDGVALTKWLRETSRVPVLLLTARTETSDRIAGLEAGADDYLSKPFEPRELVLRINAILRRSPQVAVPVSPPVLVLGPLRYETGTGALSDARGPVRLTQSETALMRIFARHPGEVITREALVEHLGRERGQPATTDAAQDRAIDVQITRLRRKIEPDPRRPRFLQTVRGEGYRLATSQDLE
jgi:two-component system phosphate regulon response regulator OmpR